MEDNKVWTREEIARIAPSYRGKPENFKPENAGKKRAPPKRRTGPTSANLPPPGMINAHQTPTPQKNEDLLAESIFGPDIAVVPIDVRDTFDANYSKIIDLADLTFEQMRPDERQIDRILIKEEFRYYSVALLWMKLIETKAKQGRFALTSAEKNILNAVKEKVYNVPQPLQIYFSQIGKVIDKTGKETELAIPTLPITVIGGFGGYHHAEINQETHNLYEEVPCLGILADVVMAASGDADNVPVTIRVAIPAHSVVTENLSGFQARVESRRPEIRQKLRAQGITETTFPEYVATTRLNLKYLDQISDLMGKFETFRNERVVIANYSGTGGMSQVIRTKPTDDPDDNTNWRIATVQATAPSKETHAVIGAAYVFGFQLFKEPGQGLTNAIRSARWSCIAPDTTSATPWVIPILWMGNRNARRELRLGLAAEQFRAVALRQDVTTENVVRRMIKTSR